MYLIFMLVLLQQLPDPDLDDELPSYMLQVEVSTKTPLQLSLAPNTVSLFTKSDIERLNLTTLEELLRLVPGFYLHKDPNDSFGTTLHGRGFFKSNGNSFLIVKDGFRVNDGYLGSAMMFSRRIPLDNVERVEIIRGPGYTLYGAYAMLGIVHITTSAVHSSARIETGSWARQNAAATYAAETNQLSWSLAFEHYEDQGQAYRFPDAEGVLRNTRDPHRELVVEFQARTADNLLFEATARDNFTWDYLGAGVVANGINRDRTRQYHVGLSKTWAKDSGEPWILKVSQSHESGYSWRTIQFQEQLYVIGVELGIQTSQLQLEKSFYFSPLLNLQAGYEYLEEHYPETEYLGIDNQTAQELLDSLNANGRDLSAKGKLPSHSLYFQDQLEISPRWHLTLGWRGELRQSEKFVHLARVGLVRNTERTTWKFHYGEGIRKPAPRELSIPLEDGQRLDKLISERLRALELSHWLKFGRRWQVLTLYYNYGYNLFNFTEDLQDPSNLQDFYFETAGLEWEAHLEFKKSQVEMNFNKTFHNADSRMPSWAGHFLYQSGGKRLRFQGEAEFLDQIAALTPSKPTQVLHASCLAQLGRGFSLRLGVNNLLDEAVLYHGDNYYPNIVPRRGREAWLRLSWKGH